MTLESASFIDMRKALILPLQLRKVCGEAVGPDVGARDLSDSIKERQGKPKVRLLKLVPFQSLYPS